MQFIKKTALTLGNFVIPDRLVTDQKRSAWVDFSILWRPENWPPPVNQRMAITFLNMPKGSPEKLQTSAF